MTTRDVFQPIKGIDAFSQAVVIYYGEDADNAGLPALWQERICLALSFVNVVIASEVRQMTITPKLPMTLLPLSDMETRVLSLAKQCDALDF